MAALSELQTEDELEQWGILDAIRQTEMRQQLPKAVGRFEFITKNNKRDVSSSTCSLEEFALSKHVMQLVSRPNTGTYLLESVNSRSASEDFKKLIDFIDTYPEPGKSELSTLVFPIFVYFYLLLLQTGPSGHLDARSFFKKYKNIFAHADSYDSVLKTLYSFRNWRDVKEDLYYKNFLECKYVIGISPDVLWALREFIKSQAEDEGEKALLYVLHFHIHFQDDDEAEYVETVSDELSPPIPERSECESIEPEDEKSVSESMSTELVTSPSKNSENEDIKLESMSDPEPVSNISLRSPSRSSESDSESGKQDDVKSDLELENLLKELDINDPQISAIVTTCASADLNSVDMNDDETEIAYALKNNYIYIAPLGVNKEQTKRSISKKDDDETQKRPRFENEERVIVPSSTPSQTSLTASEVTPQKSTKSSKSSKQTIPPSHKKRLKGSKSPKRSKSPKSSKRIKKVKYITSPSSDEDETSEDTDVDEKPPQVRDMKEIKVPGDERVYIVKYLPGRPHLLLAVCNTKVRLFNTVTNNFEAEYDGNSAFIFDIDVNSTSQYFATAHINLVSCLYSFDMNIEIRNFVGHIGPVTTVRFHPNGIYIATGSDDSTVRLYDVESGLCLRRFSGYMFSTMIIAFSPDGKLLASGDNLGIVKVWDIKDGSEISEVCFSTEIETLTQITALCFHSDSFTLMACNRKGECKILDVRSPENLQRVNFKNIPLKVKFCNGVWKMCLQRSSE